MPALTSSLVTEPAYAGPAHIVSEWLLFALPLGTPAWVTEASTVATYLLFGYLSLKLIWRLMPLLAAILVSAGNGVLVVHNVVESWTSLTRHSIRRIVRIVLQSVLNRLPD